MVARRLGDGGLELAPRHLERAPEHEVLEHLGVADDPAAAIAVGQQAARVDAHEAVHDVDAHEAVHDVVAVRGVLEREPRCLGRPEDEDGLAARRGEAVALVGPHDVERRLLVSPGLLRQPQQRRMPVVAQAHQVAVLGRGRGRAVVAALVGGGGRGGHGAARVVVVPDIAP